MARQRFVHAVLPLLLGVGGVFGLGLLGGASCACTAPLVKPGAHPSALQATIDSVREVAFVAYQDDPEVVEAVWSALDILEDAMDPDGTVPPDVATAFLNATDPLVTSDRLDPGLRTTLSRIRAVVRIMAAAAHNAG